MVEITKAYPNPVNIENLMATVRASYPEASQGELGFRVHNVDPENETTVSAALDVIIQQHNPATLTPEQAATVVQVNAKAQAAAIPNWAGWNESEVLAWFDTNITAGLPAANLAAANVVLSNMATAQRAMARMIVALRNNAWADMQD